MAGVGPAATMLVQGESGLFTLFSLVHFLWAAVFHLGWIALELGDAWVSGLLISTIATLFEMAESSRFVGTWVWSRTWGFRQGEQYRPDSLNNALSDILFSNLAFFAVQLTEVLSDGAAAARTGMAIGCGVVALVFVVAFCARQAALGDPFARPERPNPVLSISTAAPAGRRWFDVNV